MYTIKSLNPEKGNWSLFEHNLSGDIYVTAIDNVINYRKNPFICYKKGDYVCSYNVFFSKIYINHISGKIEEEFFSPEIKFFEEGHGQYRSEQRCPSKYTNEKLSVIANLVSNFAVDSLNIQLQRKLNGKHSTIFSHQTISDEMKSWGVYVMNGSNGFPFHSIEIMLPEIPLK